ncbi:MAG: nuclear transport factor 2 family protein [Acetobacteraceae bacterium]|nr:nuclear transport factor 2 family protein [Acetobacteraceae bacterium]
MTVHRRMLAASAILLAAGPVLAQGTGEQAAVARAVDALNKAMVGRDKAQLEALSAPQLSYGHSAGRIENRQQFIDNLMTGPSQFRFINLSEQTVEVSGNEAIVRHLFVAETQNRDGQVTPVRIGVLQVWQKQGADWRLLARQAYRL